MSLHSLGNKSKINELKRQSIQTMNRRGARGYVVCKKKPLGEGTSQEITNNYTDAHTASLYFHNSNERKAEKIEINREDMNKLEIKMKRRETRSKIRKQATETRMNSKHKLIDLKSKRQLDLYDKRAREWKAQESKTKKVLKRNKTENLHSAIDQFRVKKEEREIAEKIAPMVERYGEQKVWKMNLRRDDQVESRLFKLQRGIDIENKPYWVMDNPRKQVPVIRRPKSSYTNYKRRDWDNVAHKQLEKVKALNLNIKDSLSSKPLRSSRGLASNVVQITSTEKQFIWDKSQADDLIVEGKNKLNSEIESMHKNKEKSFVLYKDIAHLETQYIETMEEEVIAMDYDKQLYL